MPDILTPLEQHIVGYIETYQYIIPEGLDINRIVMDASGYFPDISTGRICDVVEALYRRGIIERTYSGTYEVPGEVR